jgi:alcohol dehydrogenase class IV
LTNAVILPYVMVANRNSIGEKSAVIARVLNLRSPNFEGLLQWVLSFREKLGIPHALATIGVNVDNSSVIGREAALDPSAAGNPMPVDAAKLEGIFRAAVAGHLKAVA